MDSSAGIPAGAGSDPARATLTVLGCDGGYPGPGGAASGYLLEAGGVAIWLEAGSGTFANLQMVTDPSRLDAVILSHEHPDHWCDVDAYALWCREHPSSRPAAVYAPPGLRARTYFGGAPVLDWHEVEPSQRVSLQPVERQGDGQTGSGGFGVVCSFGATDHGPPTLAVRVDVRARAGDPGPSAFGYSADTGPDWSPEELGAGIGLLLCEATYTRDHEGEARHLSGRQAGALAASAGISRLVVTHRRPSVPADALAAEADEAFGRPVHQASPGRIFEW